MECMNQVWQGYYVDTICMLGGEILSVSLTTEWFVLQEEPVHHRLQKQVIFDYHFDWKLTSVVVSL